MLVHRRRVASLALTATMFALAMGCTPVSLPKFDDGRNSGVGGFNGSTGTGGNNGSTSTPTPTPNPTPTPETVNYGTITWQTADVTLSEQVVLTAGAVVNNSFVVTGGIRSTNGLSRLATAFGINGNGSLTAGIPYSAIVVNGVESGICSHGTYTSNDNLLLVGGQTDVVPANSSAVSILRSGSWASGAPLPPTSPVNGGRQDFGYAQDGTHVFVVGGRGGTSTTAPGLTTDSILVADVDSTGEVSNWRLAGTLPQVSMWNSAIVLNGRLYVYGGRTDNTGTVLGTMTSYAIGNDGSLSDQQNENVALEAGGNLRALFGAAIYARNNRLYLAGGMDDQGQYTTTYVTALRSNGRLAAWRTGGALPAPLAQAAFANDGNGHFFLAGGITSGLQNSDQIYYATVSD